MNFVSGSVDIDSSADWVLPTFLIFTGLLFWRRPCSRQRRTQNQGWKVNLWTQKRISRIFWRKRKRSLRMPRRSKRKKGEQKERERW